MGPTDIKHIYVVLDYLQDSKNRATPRTRYTPISYRWPASPAVRWTLLKLGRLKSKSPTQVVDWRECDSNFRR